MSTRFRLETFKFGMYVMFPIGIMYYFGTNLEERFHVPDFWPKPEHMNKVPMEREEMKEEMARLKAQRLFLREKRLAREAQEEMARLREEEAQAAKEAAEQAGEHGENAAAIAASHPATEDQGKSEGSSTASTWRSWFQ